MTILTTESEIYVGIPATYSTEHIEQLDNSGLVRGRFANDYSGYDFSIRYAASLVAAPSDAERVTDEYALLKAHPVLDLPAATHIRNPWAWFVAMYSEGISASPDQYAPDIWAGDIVMPTDSPMNEHPMQRMNMTFPAYVMARKTVQADWCNAERMDIRLSEGAPTWRADAPGAYRSWYCNKYGQVLQDVVDYVGRRCATEIALGGYTF